MKFLLTSAGISNDSIRNALVDLLLIWRKANRIHREGGRLIFDLEGILVDPHGNVRACKPIFPKEPPVFEPDVAMLVQVAGKLRSIQHTGEHLFWIGPSEHATQHCLRATPPILTLLMSIMRLTIVIGPPFAVRLQHLRPGARVGKIVVREASLDRKQGLRVVCHGSPASIFSLRIPSISYNSRAILEENCPPPSVTRASGAP
jgi:hypothetical protein